MSTNNTAEAPAQQAVVSKEVIATDFASAMEGALPQPQIDAAVASLKATTTSYPAVGSSVSMIFYLQFQVSMKDGSKTFNGKAGGISTPGGGALYGDVYTDDLDRLYRDTVSFQFNSASVYTNLNFFDKHSNLLGSFQSGSVSTVIGTGGGSGSWS